MPESRSRKKAAYTPPTAGKSRAVRVGSRRWIAPAMLACWLVGLAWIIIYYILPSTPFFDDLGNWNLLIGMVLIAFGFVLSTRWE